MGWFKTKKTTILITIVLCTALLVLAGCASNKSTGYVPAKIPTGSGGGCGVGAPADTTDQAGKLADVIDNTPTL